MDNMNITSARFCAYCGKEVAINKKRCLYCGSLLNLPIYKQSVQLEGKPVSVSRRIIIIIFMCLVPAIGPLFGLVLGFVYKGSSSLGNQKYSFGKTLTIGSIFLLLCNVVLFFVLSSIYLNYIRMNG